MATFRKRSGSWQALVKKKGFGQIGRTFDTKTEAKTWGRSLKRNWSEAFSSPARKPRLHPFPKPLIGMSEKSLPSKKET